MTFTRSELKVLYDALVYASASAVVEYAAARDLGTPTEGSRRTFDRYRKLRMRLAEELEPKKKPV